MDSQPDLREDIVNSSLISKVLKEKYGEQYKYVSFKAKVATEKGDNFIGDLIDCEVKVEDITKGKEETLHWMCKVMKKGKMAAAMDKFNIFHREEAFYTTYLGDLDTYVKPNLLRTVPLISSLNEPDNQILVFEHMGYSGYRDPINKKAGLDKEHVNSVMKWMAELHGAGFILLKKYPGGFDSWKKKNDYLANPISAEMFDNITDEYINAFYETLKDVQAGSEEDYSIIEGFIPLIKEFFDNRPQDVSLSQKAQKLFFEPRLEFKTLIHGDPWFNNMLFKYGEGERLLDVILLDMQVAYPGNIGSDLAYFFISSVAYDNLSTNLDSYIKVYRDSLSQFIRKIEPDIEFPLSEEDIKNDLFKSLLIGFFFAMGIFPLILVEKDEMPQIDLSDIDWTSPEDSQRYLEATKANTRKLLQTNALLKGRMNGVIRFLMDVNFSKYCKY